MKVLLFVASVFVSMPLHGSILTLSCLTPANTANCQTVADGIQLTVTDEGGGIVSYLFENIGPTASIITQINWDDSDGMLATFDSITNGSGVNMLIVNPPGSVSGGGSAFANSDATFQAERENAGGSSNGIDQGESMTAFFTLSAGTSFADLLESYMAGGTNRIGMHVQAIDPSGTSDFMITDPLEGHSAPEPATFLYLAVGLATIGMARRTKKGN